MKKIISMLLVTTCMLSASLLQAQGQQNRKEMAEQRMKEVSTRLQLTPDQENKLRDIMKQNRMDMKQLREANQGATKEDKKKAFVAQLKKADDQVNGILDEKQRGLYKQYKEEKKAERQKKMQERKEDKGMMEEGLF